VGYVLAGDAVMAVRPTPASGTAALS
jgi:hypothetical protein